jgi:hypothetical protein
MPLIQSSVSIAAASVNDNVLQGSQWEFLPFNARVDFGMNGDANGTDLRIDAYSGTDVLCENLIPNVQNRVPIWPDDFNLNDVAAAGERLKIRARNTNAGAARTLFFAVRITPV